MIKKTTKGKFAFDIKGSDNKYSGTKDGDYVLVAPTEKERDEWLQTFKIYMNRFKVISSQSEILKINPLQNKLLFSKQGYITDIDSQKKYFLRLKRKELIWYYDEKEKKIFQKFSIEGHIVNYPGKTLVTITNPETKKKNME